MTLGTTLGDRGGGGVFYPILCGFSRNCSYQLMKMCAKVVTYYDTLSKGGNICQKNNNSALPPSHVAIASSPMHYLLGCLSIQMLPLPSENVALSPQQLTSDVCPFAPFAFSMEDPNSIIAVLL